MEPIDNEALDLMEAGGVNACEQGIRRWRAIADMPPGVRPAIIGDPEDAIAHYAELRRHIPTLAAHLRRQLLSDEPYE